MATTATPRQKWLYAVFKSTLAGDREIQSAANAKLFLEAVCSQPSPTTCLELILAKPAGLSALRDALRIDLSPSFLHGSATALLRYMANPALRMLANGTLLAQLVVAIVDPPIFWNALRIAIASPGAPNDSLEPFAWLVYELLLLPATDEATREMVRGLTPDFLALVQSNVLLADGVSPETRQLAYKIQKAVQLRTAPASAATADPARLLSGPGGRHDNDFVDFRRVFIYPTADELRSHDRPFYRLASAAFDSDPAERTRIHIDNQFRLLRESMLADLREGVQVAVGTRTRRRSPVMLGNLKPLGFFTGDGDIIPGSSKALVVPTFARYRSRKSSLVLSCQAGLETFSSFRHLKERRAYLKDHGSFLRHQSFGVLVRKTEIFGFAFVDRNEDLLCQLPPRVCLQFTDSKSLENALVALLQPDDVRFVLVDTAIFAVEPVLKRLQTIVEVPLERPLLLLPAEVSQEDDVFAPSADVQLYLNQLDRLSARAGEDNTVTLPPLPRLSETSSKTIELDHSQLNALRDALSSVLSTIQGPPGTGKSFIGALFVCVLYALTDCRILITTYTNHALNQCLGDLLKMGIPIEDMVRLGGSKTSAEVRPLLLSEQRSPYKRPPGEFSLMQSLEDDMRGKSVELLQQFSSYADFRINHSTLMQYLEFSDKYVAFFDALFVPDDDLGFNKVDKRGMKIGPAYLLQRWVKGEGPGIFQPQMSTEGPASVWQMSQGERARLIQRWSAEIARKQAADIADVAREHDRSRSVLDNILSESKKAILNSKRIIGCTTTAAAKYADMIYATGPDIVLVEEAGEILECQVLAALAPSVKQLVLIGDHKQLRPKVDSYPLTVEHGSGFDLNRSLFERLILQGHAYKTLHKQHRMCPEISIFSREDTYPDMVDAIPSTLNRPHPRGLQDRVIFVDHNHTEDADNSLIDRREPGAISSRSNDFEARMVLQFVRYLGQQGYGSKDIVVLTPYLGQVRHLLELFRQKKAVNAVLNDMDAAEMARAGLTNSAVSTAAEQTLRISTIDNYQGEESDIVIASLTRCNEAGDIGFMAAPERLNVLRTRARNCFVMIGSSTTFRKSRRSGLAWEPFLASLVQKGHIYDGLPVQCEQHRDKKSVLKTPEDFDHFCPDGGCSEPCNILLSCGTHICERRCHRVTDHSLIRCEIAVDRQCNRGHKTRVPCSRLNEICTVCFEEDEEVKRRAKRDLQLEADRRARQQRYKAELDQLEDEIAHNKRILQYNKEEEAVQKKLAEKRDSLAALRDTAQRMKETKAKKTAARQGKANVAVLPAPAQTWAPSSARDDWEVQKTDGAQNAALDEIMGMIGLEEVKQEFLDLLARVNIATRQDISLDKERFGCVLLGNPGTGKTTVARLLVRFFSTVGVIPGSQFQETTGAALANGGVPGCKKIIDEMLEQGGGVVFIDEAYQLASATNPGGGAVLDYLLPEVENQRGKIVFILAGYSREMEAFFAHNPGLPSRFPITMQFADYTDEELLAILALNVHNKYGGKMKAENGLDGLYCRIVSRRVGRARGRPGFGNARAMENVLSQISRRQAKRVRREKKAQETDVFLLTKEDLIGPEPANALAKSAAWKKLQKLIGLAAVKDAVAALVDSIQQSYHRELADQAPIEYSLNKLFLGNPGTGKTTVAKLYGRILVDLGLLSRNEVVVKNPADFVGAALGQSEKQTKGILAAAEGKVLVIDEAYGLYGGGGNGSGSVVDPYKTAVVDTVVAEVQSVPGDDRCVLLLGYREQMETMLQNVNPGLSRRFPLASAFNFEDFSEPELDAILDLKLHQQDYSVTDQARRVVMDLLNRARNRPNFGNAGEIDILLDTAKAKQQKRLTSMRKANKTPDASVLEAVDFDENFDRADGGETNVARLFVGTVGQEAVVARLQGLQKTVREIRALEMDPRENIPFTFLFRGPPGTGKTTTAQKMGKVYYDMGFLDAAVVEQCSATDLIGQYVGQTGPKVQQQLDRALGRVLFIDEAYRLNSSGSSFAKEATDELVDALTKPRYRNRLVVILAGYTQDIDRLMASNPGLTSRFPECIDFRALEGKECVELLSTLLRKRQATLRAKGFSLDLAVLQATRMGLAMEGLFDALAKQNNWGSARDVETLAKSIFNDAISAKQGSRIPVTKALIEKHMTKMLQERQQQSKNQNKSQSLSQLTPRLQSVTDTMSTPNVYAIVTGTTSEETPENPPQESESIVEKVGTDPPPASLDGQRDAGVSDAVWEQLQRDRVAMEAREKEYRKLKEAEKAKNELSEAVREKLVTKLIEEEERRKKEAEMRKKLAQAGCCPVGYAWVRQAAGWRCAGGSHYLGDGEVTKL